MVENLYTLDQNNLISARKSKKMTQAKMAEKQKKSLRWYTGLENTSEDVKLSSLELRNCAIALGVAPYMLLGEVPSSFTSHWAKVKSTSAFSETLLQGEADLQVAGLPVSPKQRNAIVGVAEIHEESKLEQAEDQLLSEKLKRTFKCFDLVETLVGVEAQGIETLVSAELFALPVPKLTITKLNSYHDGDWLYYLYEWSLTAHLLIDFEKTANDQPVTCDLVHGDGALDFFRTAEDDPEGHAKMVKDALKARPEISIDDDEHIFQDVAYKSPEPTVDEAHMTVKDGSDSELEKETKEDEEEAN